MSRIWQHGLATWVAVTFLAAGLAVGVSSVAGGSQKKDIVDTAVAAGSFETLTKALRAADLVDTLKGEGPFTVFAPTDEAFAKLPAGTLEDLLKPENKEKLAAILTYHVVSGRVVAEEAMKLSSVKTVNGKELALRTEYGKLMVNGTATVTKPDIHCTNGVIHVVDAVLLPE
jgi:uncharacterized surface protein with fasciclin (FAS1) repeats